jgi:hypothetical protein
MTQDTLKVQKMQDEIFKKMTADRKIQLVSQFFEFAKKLQALNNRRIHGSNQPPRHHR